MRPRIGNHRSLLGYGMAETDNESMWGHCRSIREEGDSVQFRRGSSKLSAWLPVLSIIRTAVLSKYPVYYYCQNNLQLDPCKNALFSVYTPPDGRVPRAMDSDSTG